MFLGGSNVRAAVQRQRYRHVDMGMAVSQVGVPFSLLVKFDRREGNAAVESTAFKAGLLMGVVGRKCVATYWTPVLLVCWPQNEAQKLRREWSNVVYKGVSNSRVAQDVSMTVSMIASSSSLLTSGGAGGGVCSGVVCLAPFLLFPLPFAAADDSALAAALSDVCLIHSCSDSGPPSMRTCLSSAGMPSTVPWKRDSSPVLLCFFLSAVVASLAFGRDLEDETKMCSHSPVK